MTIGLSRQEYHTLIEQMKEGKPLSKYKGRFNIITKYEEPKQDVIMLEVNVKDAETAFHFGKWIAMIHAMQVEIFGENYKIDSQWEQKQVQAN